MLTIIDKAMMLELLRSAQFAPRSSLWPKCRNEFLLEHPICAACGGNDFLSVHHKKPFHLFPELELDHGNLITLCESGPGGVNCHLVFGHCGNWIRYNPRVEVTVRMVRRMFRLAS